MYHLTVDNMRDCARRLVVLIAFFSCLLPAAAEDARLFSHNPSLAGYGESSGNEYPILRRQDKLRKKPVKVQIFQIDREAIGDRQPLLLVHGLRGEYLRDFRWDKVIRRLTT